MQEGSAGADSNKNSDFYLMLLESCPVKLNPDTRSVRGHRPVVLENERSHRVLVDREAVNFEPATMRLRRDQADMQFLHAMGTNRNATFARYLGNLQPSGNSSTVGGIRLYKREPRLLKREAKLVHRAQVLSRGQRYTRFSRDPRMTFEVLG